MLRKSLLVLSVMIGMAALLCGPVWARTAVPTRAVSNPVSPDGLQLVSFRVSAPRKEVGKALSVTFTLKNVSGHDIILDSNGIFVGARWNSSSDANNRDFGHQHRNRVIKNNRTIGLKATMRFDQPGVWRVWPAYHVGGHYGPFRWQEQVMEVSGLQGGSGTGSGSAGGAVSSDGLQLTSFQVKLPRGKVVVVGSKVPVIFTLRNVSGHDITFDSNGVFVGARWNSTGDENNRDFGHGWRSRVLRHKKSVTIKATLRPDQAGVWRVWPAYHLNGHYGPFRWQEKIIQVRPYIGHPRQK